MTKIFKNWANVVKKIKKGLMKFKKIKKGLMKLKIGQWNYKNLSHFIYLKMGQWVYKNKYGLMKL